MAWEEFHRTGIYVAKSVSPHFRRVFQNLNEPECLVEVGCGTGRNLEYLREAFPYSDICATDLSVDALEKIHVDNIEKAAGDMRDNPFKSECFTHSVSWRVIHSLDERGRREAFEELRRLTKRGGYSVVAVRSSSDKRYGIGTECEKDSFVVLDSKELPEGEVFYKKDVYQPWHFFPETELMRSLGKTGFLVNQLHLISDDVGIPSFYTGSNLYWMAIATRVR